MTMLLIYHFPHRKKVNTSFAAQASLLITYPIIMKLSPPYWFQYILSLGKPEIWGQMQEANDQTTGTIAAAGLLSQISFFPTKKYYGRGSCNSLYWKNFDVDYYPAVKCGSKLETG